MQNLAGNSCADAYIRDELRVCKIPQLVGLRSTGEVSTYLTGKLGNFTFDRAWTYWVVKGPVPLDVAHELYYDPAGTYDIRVAGFAGNLPPEMWGEYIEWITPDEMRVFPASREPATRRFGATFPDMPLLPRALYSDDPASLGAEAFIGSYHIDTLIGLRVFADALRAHNLV